MEYAVIILGLTQVMNFQVLEFNGEDNHVHALIEYPPKLSISQIVNALKGVSSRRYGRLQKTPIKKHYGVLVILLSL